jgi:hypothetical protein
VTTPSRRPSGKPPSTASQAAASPPGAVPVAVLHQERIPACTPSGIVRWLCRFALSLALPCSILSHAQSSGSCTPHGLTSTRMSGTLSACLHCTPWSSGAGSCGPQPRPRLRKHPIVPVIGSGTACLTSLHPTPRFPFLAPCLHTIRLSTLMTAACTCACPLYSQCHGGWVVPWWLCCAGAPLPYPLTCGPHPQRPLP